MPVEDLQKRNNLDGNNISPGKYLHVGWISTEGVPREYRKLKPVPPEWQTSQLNERHYLQAKGIKIEKSESLKKVKKTNKKNHFFSKNLKFLKIFFFAEKKKK